MKRFYPFIFVLPFCLMACKSSQVVQQKSKQPTSYSIIYVIHGDANYLYHNANGGGLQADEHALQEAKRVAEQATEGEVFIFHQNPEHKILWLFPKKDRQFLYYRNGKLIRNQRYSPESDKQSFVTEAALYKRFHTVDENPASYKKVFLYFGHEVPEKPGHVYHYSRPHADFDTEVFAQGVQSFLQPGDDAFDLTVLSTCNNGTPAMIHTLSPYTRYVLASPQNLHLSHIDTQALSLLQQDADIHNVADSLANQTYKRLSSFLQTVVTLSVYDTKATASYMPSLDRAYEHYLSTKEDSKVPLDNVDCANFSFFDADQASKGVEVWYKAPQFGQREKSSSYSGWGCQARE